MRTCSCPFYTVESVAVEQFRSRLVSPDTVVDRAVVTTVLGQVRGEAVDEFTEWRRRRCRAR